MNRDTYTLEERFLAWLFQEHPADALWFETPDPLDSEVWADSLGDASLTDPAPSLSPETMHLFDGKAIPRSSGHEPLKLGAKSVVQERFYTLLKQRFQREMEARPPLFPWETELMEYEDTLPATLGLSAWEPQLRQLRLPVALPDEILAKLFQRCQDLAQSAVQDGRRLVEAVESLFAVDPQSLNLLANAVRLGYSRDGEGLATRLLGNSMPETYASAPQQQQLTLAMIAAYEMLNRLTLKLSAAEPSISQSWETAAGPLLLHLAYGDGTLRVEAELPAGGSVRLEQGAQRTQAERTESGSVVLQMMLQPESICRLQVSLVGGDAPLGFAIQL